MVEHFFNPRQVVLSVFDASLDYKECFRTVRVIKKNSVKKKTNRKNKNKKTKTKQQQTKMTFVMLKDSKEETAQNSQLYDVADVRTASYIQLMAMEE